MHSSVCIKPQFTLTPSSSTKPLFNRVPWVFSCQPHAEVSVAKIRSHYYLDWFAKCFLDVSQTHEYTHISFSKGTLWKLNCVPFSKYWPQPLAMYLLPFLRGVVTSSFIGVVILYLLDWWLWLLFFANQISINNWHGFCVVHSSVVFHYTCLFTYSKRVCAKLLVITFSTCDYGSPCWVQTKRRQISQSSLTYLCRWHWSS